MSATSPPRAPRLSPSEPRAARSTRQRDLSLVWLGVVVAIAFAAIALVWVIDRAVTDMMAGPVAEFSDAQIADRPDLDEVLGGYTDLASEGLLVIPDWVPGLVWEPYTAEDVAYFNVGPGVNHKAHLGPQVVDGHPVLSWAPWSWDAKVALPQDEAKVAELRSAFAALVEPYGFTMTSDPPLEELYDGTTGVYLRAQDKYGAYVSFGGDSDRAGFKIQSGPHLWAASDAPCGDDECLPSVSVP